MDIKTCRFCRKNFKGFSALCPNCVEELDKKYVTVRNYLDQHKESNISLVAEKTEVDEKSLLFLIREGRLALRADSSEITCMKCGSPIQSGKYCEKCKKDLVRTLESTRNSMENSLHPVHVKPANVAEEKGRMHILKDK